MSGWAAIGAGLLAGAGGAWLASRLPPAWGWLDTPSGRSSHRLPTPKGGGVGIVLAFLLIGLAAGLDPFFLLPAALLALGSLLGDRWPLSPRLRLLGQVLAAGVVVAHLPPAAFPAQGLGPLLAVLFLVGTANFYNFMDGSNGMAGLSGVIAFALLACYGLAGGFAPGWIALCAGVAAACCGFLPFNCPRARVFMGDGGSILLGFAYAGVVLAFAGSAREWLVLGSFLFPFYADELLSMGERLLARQSLFLPHRRHLYQLLVNEVGLAHWRVAAGYGLLQLAVGLGVWAIAARGGAGAVVGVLFMLFLLVAGGNCWVKRRWGQGQTR